MKELVWPKDVTLRSLLVFASCFLGGGNKLKARNGDEKFREVFVRLRKFYRNTRSEKKKKCVALKEREKWCQSQVLSFIRGALLVL